MRHSNDSNFARPVFYCYVNCLNLTVSSLALPS